MHRQAEEVVQQHLGAAGHGGREEDERGVIDKVAKADGDDALPRRRRAVRAAVAAVAARRVDDEVVERVEHRDLREKHADPARHVVALPEPREHVRLPPPVFGGRRHAREQEHGVLRPQHERTLAQRLARAARFDGHADLRARRAHADAHADALADGGAIQCGVDAHGDTRCHYTRTCAER